MVADADSGAGVRRVTITRWKPVPALAAVAGVATAAVRATGTTADNPTTSATSATRARTYDWRPTTGGG